MSKYKILIVVLLSTFLGFSAYAAGGGSMDSSSPDMGMGSSKSAVDINSASVDELKNLPGISSSLAQNIVDYRNANGPFKSIEELKNVKGMTNSKFNRIKDSVALGSTSPGESAPSAPSEMPASPDSTSPTAPSEPTPPASPDTPPSPGPSTY